MAYTDPLLAISDALYGVLAFDSTLQALAPGGVYFDVPQINQATVFPFVWLEPRQNQTFTGFGAQPGRKSRPGIQLRVHIFQSDYGTVRESQLAMQRIAELLWNDAAPLDVSGYIVYCDGKPLPVVEEFPFFVVETIAGLTVKELVLQTNYMLEEAE